MSCWVSGLVHLALLGWVVLFLGLFFKFARDLIKSLGNRLVQMSSYDLIGDSGGHTVSGSLFCSTEQGFPGYYSGPCEGEVLSSPLGGNRQ